MTDDGLLTVREVARVCHRSEETVRRWIWSGKLPARKLGNQHFIDPADLQAMQASQPRAAETRAEYRTAAVPLDHPLSDGKGGYDREKTIKWWEKTKREIDQVHSRRPPRDPDAPSVAEEIEMMREERMRELS